MIDENWKGNSLMKLWKLFSNFTMNTCLYEKCFGWHQQANHSFIYSQTSVYLHAYKVLSCICHAFWLLFCFISFCFLLEFYCMSHNIHALTYTRSNIHLWYCDNLLNQHFRRICGLLLSFSLSYAYTHCLSHPLSVNLTKISSSHLLIYDSILSNLLR